MKKRKYLRKLFIQSAVKVFSKDIENQIQLIKQGKLSYINYGHAVGSGLITGFLVTVLTDLLS